MFRYLFIACMVSVLWAIPRNVFVNEGRESMMFPRTPDEMERIAPLEVDFTGFDILRYDAFITFDIPSRYIYGKVNLSVRLLDTIDTLFIDLSHLLIVDSLYLNDTPSDIITSNDSIRIPLEH
ncbi:MAG: hypothetical protein ACPL6C_04630, partial [bacterium]